MALPQYTLTYTCGNGSGTPPAAVSVPTGGYVNIAENTCTAPSGQYFSHWSCSNSPSTQYSAGAQYDVQLILNADTGNVTCTAQWTSTLSCPVTYNYGSCSKSYGADSSAYGSDGGAVYLIPTVSQVCETDSNCNNVSSCVGNGTFQGWNCGDTLWGESCAPLVSGSIFAPGTAQCKLSYYDDSWSNCGATCTAIYDYTVSYSCGTGSGTPSSGTATTNQSFTFAAANVCTGASGATFTGWSCDNGVGNKSAGQTISSWGYHTGTTCTAQWSGGNTPSTSCDKECETKNIADSEFGAKGDMDGQQFGYIDADKNATNAEEVGISDVNTWGVRFDYGTITGSAMCDEIEPSGDVLETTGNPVGTTGTYCWCNANKYTSETGSAIDLITDWIYTYQFGDPRECDARCAEMCANQFSTKLPMRENVYNSGTYCECPSYTVTYSCGRGASGTAPTDATQYSSGDTVTTSASAGTCRKSNSTFIGWTCGGTNVNAGGTFNINGDTTCSARWQTTQIQFYVTYHQGTAGNAPIYGNDPTAPTSCIYGGTCNAPNNTYTVDGYTFAGWSCTSNYGTCAQAIYQPGDSISTATSANGAIIELNAQWTANSTPETYTVTYACGVGTGTPPTDNTGYASNSSVTTLANTCTAPTNATFINWDCNGTLVNAGSTFAITSNTTCVAQWSCNTGYQESNSLLLDGYGDSSQIDYSENQSVGSSNNDGNDGASYRSTYTYGDVYVHCEVGAAASLYTVSITKPAGSAGCWCRISQYETYDLSTTPWVYLGSTGSTDEQCTSVGGRAVAESGTLRELLYNSPKQCTPNDYTITLNDNGGSGGSGTIYTTYNTNVYNDSARSNAMTSANPVAIPTYSNRTFQGYYSAITGGTQYIDANGRITTAGLAAGKGYTDNNQTWYAQWSVETFNVRYSCGVGTGTAPTDNQNYQNGATVVAKPNACSNSGGSFAGWSCNGVVVNAGSTFTITGHTLCVAQWNCGAGYHEYNPLIEHVDLAWDSTYYETNPDSMTIPNVGTIQIKAMISSESGIDSNEYPIAMYYEPNKPTTTTETEGYCWCRVIGFTPTNGTYESIDYLPWIPISGQRGSTESCQEMYCREFLISSFPDERMQELMARKTALCTGSKCVPNTFNVVYAGNGNDGGSAPSAPTTCTYGETCNAPSNTYTKTGYDFDKWACSADSGNCSSGTYSAGADISTATTINNATITLTAQWSGTKINLKWRSNGDAITSTPEYCYYGSLANTPGGINDIQQPTKRGYTFAGWKVTAWQDN